MKTLRVASWLVLLACPFLTGLGAERAYKPKAREIAVSAEPRHIPLIPLQSFDAQPGKYNRAPQWLIRRMTEKRFEVWTPREGWLFNEEGKVLNHVKVPRRDGQGREWYGAFLPDGQWITTDLWEQDCTLMGFSPEGKWLWEIPSETMTRLIYKETGQEKHGPWFDRMIISWARSDAAGKGWVVNVGSEGGVGTVLVSSQRQIRFLPGTSKWQECFPRMLGPRGFYIHREIPSDDGTLIFVRSEAGHGPRVGYPEFSLHRVPYDWSGNNRPVFSVVLPHGEHQVFGFWPGSTRTYISRGGSWDPQQEETPEDEKDFLPTTWFFNANGVCEGWVRGKQLADFPDQHGMFFADDKGVVVGVSEDLKVTSVRVFRWDEKTAASPRMIYPDLGLGFFLMGKQPVLARFREEMNH